MFTLITQSTWHITLLTSNVFIVQNQDFAAEAQKAAALQDELDVAKGFEEKAVSGFVSCVKCL